MILFNYKEDICIKKDETILMIICLICSFKLFSNL